MTDPKRMRLDLNLDLDEFKPEPKKIDPGAKEATEEVAIASGFKTRHAPEKEAKPQKAAEKAPVEMEARRRGRKRTTNRSTPFAVKLRLDTNNKIYDLADRLDCSAIAEVIELALDALEEKIAAGKNPRAK